MCGCGCGCPCFRLHRHRCVLALFQVELKKEKGEAFVPPGRTDGREEETRSDDANAMSCLSFLHTVVPAPSVLHSSEENRRCLDVLTGRLRNGLLSTHGPAHETLTAQARRRSAHGPARNSQPSPRDRRACRLQLGFKHGGGGRGRNACSILCSKEAGLN
jgi:hypothetical protein